MPASAYTEHVIRSVQPNGTHLLPPLFTFEGLGNFLVRLFLYALGLFALYAFLALIPWSRPLQAYADATPDLAALSPNNALYTRETALLKRPVGDNVRAAQPLIALSESRPGKAMDWAKMSNRQKKATSALLAAILQGHMLDIPDFEKSTPIASAVRSYVVANYAGRFSDGTWTDGALLMRAVRGSQLKGYELCEAALRNPLADHSMEGRCSRGRSAAWLAKANTDMRNWGLDLATKF